MSNDTIKIIAAEWLKLKHRRTTIVIPLLVLALAVIFFFGLDLATRREWIGIPSGFNVAAGSINLVIKVLVLVVVIATCFHISREFALGTVKSAWVRPVTRNAWFAGKIISAVIAMSALFLFVVAVIMLLAAWRFGLADLMEKDYLVHSASSLGWRMLLTIAMTLWGLWATIAVVAMLAGFFNHPGGAIAAGLGVGFLMTVLGIFPAVSPYLLSTYISLPIEQMTAMSKGLPLPYSWGDVARLTLIGGGVWMIVGLVVGQQTIKRKEITF
jgi:hypothetical protein